MVESKLGINARTDHSQRSHTSTGDGPLTTPGGGPNQPDQEQELGTSTTGPTGCFTSGYIFLYRRILENPIWHQLPAEWLKVWIGILLRANFRPSKWWDGFRQIDIPAGAFVTSIDKLALFCKVTPKQIRGTLQYLERAGMVARQRAAHYSIITILNWETYQAPQKIEGIAEGIAEGDGGAATTAGRGQGEGRARATEEEVNKAIRQEEHTNASPREFPNVRQFRKAPDSAATIPLEYEGFNFPEWIDARWKAHPLAGVRTLAETAAAGLVFRADGFLPDAFDRAHDAWIDHWKAGGFPSACNLEKFITDEWWRKMPPERDKPSGNSVMDRRLDATQRAMAKAIERDREAGRC